MTTRTLVLCCALAMSVEVAHGSSRAPAADKANGGTVDLSGRWAFNPELSDKTPQGMGEGMPRRGGPGGGGMGGPGGGGPGAPGGGGMGGRGGGPMGPPPGGTGGGDPREAMRAIIEPAEELAVTQSEGEIMIDEKAGRTRRLHPDGRKYKADNGASEIKTSWKDGKLQIETKGRPQVVVETWELVPDRSRIIVIVKMEGSFSPSLTYKRIYDRAGESEPD